MTDLASLAPRPQSDRRHTFFPILSTTRASSSIQVLSARSGNEGLVETLHVTGLGEPTKSNLLTSVDKP